MPDHDYLKAVTIGAPETPQGAILLCDYDPHWPALYAQERAKIACALAGQSVRIEHVLCAWALRQADHRYPPARR